MDKRSGIYAIVNTADGKFYVGSAVNFADRWKTHRIDLREQRHHSVFLQRAWNKHGAEAFDFRVMMLCPKENLIAREQLAIDGYHPEYNMNPTAGSRLGSKLTPEQCAKRSIQSKAQWANNYEKMRAATAGSSWKNRTTHSAETRAKISATKTGSKINYPSGRKSRGPQPLEVREKIAAAQRGVPKPKPTEETRAKLRAAQQARRLREGCELGSQR